MNDNIDQSKYIMDDETRKKAEEQKKRMDEFKDEHKGQKITCKYCGGSYTYYNKYQHNKSQKHALGVKWYNEMLKNRLM
jgi:hypothetical protein